MAELEDLQEQVKSEQAGKKALIGELAALRAEHQTLLAQAKTDSDLAVVDLEVCLLHVLCDGNYSHGLAILPDTSEPHTLHTHPTPFYQTRLAASQETVRQYEAKGKRAAKAANEFKAQVISSDKL